MTGGSCCDVCVCSFAAVPGYSSLTRMQDGAVYRVASFLFPAISVLSECGILLRYIVACAVVRKLTTDHTPGLLWAHYSAMQRNSYRTGVCEGLGHVSFEGL